MVPNSKFNRKVGSLIWRQRNIAILRETRDPYSSQSRGAFDRPIRRFASDVNPDLAKASRHWTRPFIRVDTCVPGKGSFQRQRGKSAQDAFREAQFLRERHSSRLRSVFHIVEAFFREIGFVQRRFLQLPPTIAMSIVRRRGRKKTLVKDAPRPSPGDRDEGWGPARRRLERGDLMAMPIALADNLRLVYRRWRNQLCKWLNHWEARNHSWRGTVLSPSLF